MIISIWTEIFSCFPQVSLVVRWLPPKYLLCDHDKVTLSLALSCRHLFSWETKQDKNQRDNTEEQSLTHELVRKAKNPRRPAPSEKKLFPSLGAPTLNWKKFSGSSGSSSACICFDKVVCQRSKAFTFCCSCKLLLLPFRWPWYDVVFYYCKSHESPMGVANALFCYTRVYYSY